MEMFVGPRFRKQRKTYFQWAEQGDEESNDVRNTPLSSTSLPLKVVNCLDSHGVWTLGQLAEKDPEFILTMKNSGSVCLRLCETVLAEHNLDENFKIFYAKNSTSVSTALSRKSKRKSDLDDLFTALDDIF